MTNEELLAFTIQFTTKESLALRNRLALWQSSFMEVAANIDLFMKLKLLQIKGNKEEGSFFSDDRLDAKDYMLLSSALSQIIVVQLHRFKSPGNAMGATVRKTDSTSAKEMRRIIEQKARDTLKSQGKNPNRYDEILRTIELYRDQLIAHDDAKALFANDVDVHGALANPQTISHFGAGTFSHRDHDPKLSFEEMKDVYAIAKALLGATILVGTFLTDK